MKLEYYLHARIRDSSSATKPTATKKHPNSEHMQICEAAHQEISDDWNTIPFLTRVWSTGNYVIRSPDPEFRSRRQHESKTTIEFTAKKLANRNDFDY